MLLVWTGLKTSVTVDEDCIKACMTYMSVSVYNTAAFEGYIR